MNLDGSLFPHKQQLDHSTVSKLVGKGGEEKELVTDSNHNNPAGRLQPALHEECDGSRLAQRDRERLDEPDGLRKEDDDTVSALKPSELQTNYNMSKAMF